jgi:hypothetical protein
MEKNPYLEPENYFKGYQESIDNLKNNPQVIEFDKLCYELFEHQEVGRRFIELIKERVLMPALVSRGNNTYQVDILWQEGYKDAFRMIVNSVNSHKQRILAGTI